MKHGHSLETARLVIRPWNTSETDRDAMHALQSNPIARKYYPQRRNRQESDRFLEKVIDFANRNSLGWAAVCLKGNDRPIGFSGLSKFEMVGLSFTPVVETGWQYCPNHWGNGYATEAAEELLRHGFEDLMLPKIVAFAVPANTGSIAVMKRIGMREVPNGAFDHPMVPESHPHLKKHVLYELKANAWQTKSGPKP